MSVGVHSAVSEYNIIKVRLNTTEVADDKLVGEDVTVTLSMEYRGKKASVFVDNLEVTKPE